MLTTRTPGLLLGLGAEQIKVSVPESTSGWESKVYVGEKESWEQSAVGYRDHHRSSIQSDLSNPNSLSLSRHARPPVNDHRWGKWTHLIGFWQFLSVVLSIDYVLH